VQRGPNVRPKENGDRDRATDLALLVLVYSEIRSANTPDLPKIEMSYIAG
jgi:hypothetical protein